MPYVTGEPASRGRCARETQPVSSSSETPSTATAEEPRAISPLLKIALELGPLIAFFVSFNMLKEPGAEDHLNALLGATGVFIAVMAVAMTTTWVLTRKLSRMAVITGAVVLVMGALTFWLNDATFLLVRPTIVNAAFAAILTFGLLRGQSYLEYLMGELLPLDHTGWMKLTRNWAIYFACVAVVNEIVWRTLGQDMWVTVKTFGYPAAAFIFMMAQTPLIAKHAIEEEENDKA